MTTFDGWDARYCGDSMALPPGMISEDYLMHFRTKGSKNGYRRYQNEDGSWTPLGLRLRKEREGWGETKKERKAEKRVQRAEQKAERAKKTAERRAAFKENLVRNKRRSGLENLSDDELKRKLERAKMEAEYKELTKSPILKAGEKALASYMENRSKKADREAAKAKMELDLKRVEADITRAREGTRKAKQEAKKAKQERKVWQTKAKQDEQAAALKKAKTDWKATTLHGGIIRRLNAKMTSGVSEMYKSKRTKIGEVKAQEIMAAYNNKKNQEKLRRNEKAQKERDKQAKRDQEQARKREEQDWLVKAAASRMGRETRKKSRAFNSWG